MIEPHAPSPVRGPHCILPQMVYPGQGVCDVLRSAPETHGISGCGRFCCKSLFALAIKNSFGRRRDFRVKMWETSSPEDKLTGDLGNVIEATSIGGRRSDFFTARKLARGNLRLLQQYRHKASTPR